MERKQKAVVPTPYKEREESECLWFRYIYCQCYELKLPDGTTIVTDPFISGAVDDFTVDELTGADYIILNHTHFDHDMDVRRIWDCFHGRVICQKEVAMEVARSISPTAAFTLLGRNAPTICRNLPCKPSMGFTITGKPGKGRTSGRPSRTT